MGSLPRTTNAASLEIADQLPPHDFEAEQALLGCVLLDSTCLDECATLLRHGRDSFYDLRNRNIYDACMGLHLAENAVDAISVKNLLEAKGLLNEENGFAYISGLPEATPSAANLRYYIDILNEKSGVRELSKLSDKIRQRIRNGLEYDAIAEAVQSDMQRALHGQQSAIEARPWIEINAVNETHESVVLGPGRWITRGNGLFVIAPTGAGKSTWTATQAFSWAINRASLGIRPNGPLSSLIIQSEDEDGDLAEMRDGILESMELSEADRAGIAERVFVHTEKSETGTSFLCKVVRPLLRKHSPDLLWLNPLGAYFGGELNKQEEVARFFRNTLNPILAEFNCAAVVVHHTPKPTEDKKKWNGGELAYFGAGSADMANWSRETIVLREMAEGLFEMVATKRWRRLGWTDSTGRPINRQIIAHGKGGKLYWRIADAADIGEAGIEQFSESALADMIPDEGIDKTELIHLASKRFQMSDRQARRYVDDLSLKSWRRVQGVKIQTTLAKESDRPRRDVYPDRPSGRPVVWIERVHPREVPNE